MHSIAEYHISEQVRHDCALELAMALAKHAFPAKHRCIEDAASIVRYDQIRHVGQRWEVQSQSHGDTVYRTTWSTCTCLARLNHPGLAFCRHSMAVALWLKTHELLDDQWEGSVEGEGRGLLTATETEAWYVWQTPVNPTPRPAHWRYATVGLKCQTIF